MEVSRRFVRREIYEKHRKRFFQRINLRREGCQGNVSREALPKHKI